MKMSHVYHHSHSFQKWECQNTLSWDWKRGNGRQALVTLFFIIIVCLTHTHKNYHSKKKYKWYKYAVYLKCLCGIGPISVWMPLEAMWNAGVKQVRISKERKDVDILSRVCSIWKYLEPGKCGMLET